MAEFLLRLMPVCDVSLVLYYILFISYASWERLIFLLEIFKNIETQTRTPIASRTNVKAMSVNAMTTFFYEIRRIFVL